jgi:tRNA 2-thiouridine synthesizing protein A
MAEVKRDYRGLKCPLPVLKLNQLAMKKEVNPGDVLEVTADCATFEEDVKKWCTTSKKVLLKCYKEGSAKIAKIQF